MTWPLRGRRISSDIEQAVIGEACRYGWPESEEGTAGDTFEQPSGKEHVIRLRGSPARQESSLGR